MTKTDLYKHVDRLLQKAEKIALEHGIIVGRVSRQAPSSINEEGGALIFDVDPEIYFNNYIDLAQSGGYLAVVDIKTGDIVSLQIIEVERRDVLSELQLPDFTLSLPLPEPTGLLTRTRVKAKPLLAYNPENGVVQAANYVIEPQSPIIKPLKPETVQRILGLPTEGVFLGYVTIGEAPIFNGLTPLFIPVKAFYQHILVLGTTGSGKTTLLKNLVASIYSGYKYEGERPTIIVMDPNKDYVHLPLKPLWEKTPGINWDLEVDLARNISDYVRKPNGIMIILPITQYVIDRLIHESEITWVKALLIIAQDYFDTVYKGVIEKINAKLLNEKIEVIEQEFKGKKLRYALIEASVRYCDGEEDYIEIYIVPYGFLFKNMTPREFIELNPFFTQQARDSLYRLLIRLRKEDIIFNTLREFYNALSEARIQKGKREKIGITLDPRINAVTELLSRLAIHRATLENIIRQVGSLVDTGFFDIEILAKAGEKYLSEPCIECLLELHEKMFKKYPVVIDLEYLQENSPTDPEQTIAIAAFRILNRVFQWKMIKARMREPTQPIIILIDEAHRFFPSRSGRRDEYIEHISGMIDRIARLGRARGLGLVFSTHSPKDVHDIILQLTNTKIILRMDKSTLTALDIPSEYRDFIIKAGDRVGLIKTHAIRLGYTTFRTTLPLVGHYDLSALSLKK